MKTPIKELLTWLGLTKQKKVQITGKCLLKTPSDFEYFAECRHYLELFFGCADTLRLSYTVVHSAACFQTIAKVLHELERLGWKPKYVPKNACQSLFFTTIRELRDVGYQPNHIASHIYTHL